MIDSLQSKIKIKLIIILFVSFILGIWSLPKTNTYATWVTERPLDNIFKRVKPDLVIDEQFKNNIKKDIRLTNTGELDVYVRVKLSERLVDSENNIYPSHSIQDFELDENWIKIGNYYYYKQVLNVGEKTTDLLNGSEITFKQASDKKLQVDVIAQSLQSHPQDIVEETWGLIINDEGIITGGKL